MSGNYGDWNHDIKMVISDRWNCSCGKWSIPWSTKGVTEAFSRHLLKKMREQNIMAMHRGTADEAPIRLVASDPADHLVTGFIIQMWKDDEWKFVEGAYDWEQAREKWASWGGQPLRDKPPYPPTTRREK
ncbi:hypothetical protein BJD55_gp145 [Gordonia phage Yvonnetastic]|uniref:Uncharacterized protein n=1 Tax=Gordonia phage Yvonnetastic TaxID=1821566 RepID=A0A142K938_9CAUD|nr:hypothetical protein BJD55_gp145 [Gordonia phage Yvonnetastic]AMS02621.1 hypothetical protein SEA_YVONNETASTIC_77 [Gordonia phage Yvonnetastic]WKW86053.1 hypothetical protein SEA_JONJAMES_79 [Gordonia Phage JonJames]